MSPPTVRPHAFVVLAAFVACSPSDTETACPPPDSGACTCPPTTPPEPALPRDVDVAALPPFVVTSAPAHLDLEVDPALPYLEVTYSKDMGPGYAWLTRDDVSPPLGASEWVDPRTNRVEATLEPSTTYTVQLNGGAYYGFAGVDDEAAMPFVLVFRTAAASPSSP